MQSERISDCEPTETAVKAPKIRDNHYLNRIGARLVIEFCRLQAIRPLKSLASAPEIVQAEFVKNVTISLPEKVLGALRTRARGENMPPNQWFREF
jgi:hypothetical protein